jgi:hypothetical protein
MVQGDPLHAFWTVGITPLTKKPMLILSCTVHFAHTGKGSVIIKHAYLKGTNVEIPVNEIVVQGTCDDPSHVLIGVTPVRAKPGESFVCKLVFVDQFNDPHTSDIAFRPNTLPEGSIVSRLEKIPNCVFCDKPVQVADQAKEAQVTAHTTCIWR